MPSDKHDHKEVTLQIPTNKYNVVLDGSCIDLLDAIMCSVLNNNHDDEDNDIKRKCVRILLALKESKLV